MPVRFRRGKNAFGAVPMALAAALLAASGIVGADEAYRREIEDDWRRQDQRRVEEIRRPGLVRFPQEELQWPGVADAALAEGLNVPETAAPKIDGRLDDPSWQQAVQAPPGPSDHPVVPVYKLCRDAKHVYVAATFPTEAEANFYPATAALDAGGAVDGVKNGSYAFHTNHEPNPWWQVDLGQKQPLAKIVVYNRVKLESGIHNADNLIILTSDDEKFWIKRYANQGKHFGGVGHGKPLEVAFDKEKVEARFVRLQIPSDEPIYFHLDEVEVYGPADPQKNLALGRPALQSSTSMWSKGGSLCELGGVKFFLHGAGDGVGIAADGKRLSTDAAQVRREAGQTCVELAVPVEGQPAGFPAAFAPYHGKPVPLAVAGGLEIVWPDAPRLGFGHNRLALEVRSARALDPPVELTVETAVFTQQGAVRQVVAQKQVTAPGPVALEFPIRAEGAAAIIATLRQGGTSVRDGRAFFVAPVREALDRAERIAAEAGLALAPSHAALRQKADALAAREAADGPDPAAREILYREVRWLARETAFRARLDFDRLLVLKRFCQESFPDVCLNHMPWCSRPGGDICAVALGRCDEPCQVRNLIDGRLGPGRPHGMDLWFDATRAVFGYAKSKTNDPPPGWLDRRTSFELRRNEEPTHIYEIHLDGAGIRQLTDGEWSDIDPAYLPSGRIAFVSERCGYSLQCNEMDKDETSTNLYVMDADGGRVRRLSVTKDGDYLPHTLDDGTIAYTRWEYQERGWAHVQSIWTIRPDGTGADALYKQHMNDPWALEDTRSVPGSQLLVATATGHHTLPAGPVVLVDVRHGMNNPAGLRIVTPGVIPPEGGMTGRCVAEGGVRGVGGYYMNPWALSEKAFLAAYAWCNGRITGMTSEIDPAGYGIYLIDVVGTKELVYRDPAISCFTPIPLRPRPKPPVLPDLTDPNTPYAVCSAADVGRGVEGVDPKAIRYIRVARRPPWPYCNTYGGQRYEPDVKSVMINWTPAEVIGTVPVEADGSAHFTVPVDKAVYFQLLDENFMELRRMRSFISFQPGEFRGCTGCHESREHASHHAVTPFPLALAKEPAAPQAPPWGVRPMSFLRDVQPVLDAHCAACHGGLKPAAGLDLSGGLTARYNRAYDAILAAWLVSRSNVGDDARITQPLAFGSHRSKLAEVVRTGPCSTRAKLSPEDWLRLVTWMDLNGPYHDGFINKRQNPPPYDLPNDQDLLGKLAAIHQRRCAACHQPAEVTRADWIDLHKPEASRFLAAPLAKEAGGAGRCGQAVYAVATDPDYRAALDLVRAAVQEAWKRPRRDLAALREPPRP